VTLRPCLDCGEPTDGPRCDEHTVDTKAPASARGYDHQWTLLSRRARRLQPFCSGCGSTEDLQADHLPIAWERKAAGKPVRLSDIQVLCGPCNRDAGAARGHTATRGEGPSGTQPDPLVRPSLSHSPRGAA
jgi:5-methylcytosine-specific restriction endonuclease McrA